MEPTVKPLSQLRRQIFFLLLLLCFVIALPVFIFYATGYRYNFFSDSPMITATGGLYIVTASPQASIYVNEEPVRNTRVFRSAAYVQGLSAGMHRVHVQAPGTATWVKELFVYPHIVTEVESFNMPLLPQVRPITPYLTTSGVPVVVVASTSTVPFLGATTTVDFVATTSRATSTLVANREHARLVTLYDEKASTTALRVELAALDVEMEPFVFATSTRPATTSVLYTLATTTVETRDMRLYEAGDEVYAQALGTGRDIPGYFCILTAGTTTDPSLLNHNEANAMAAEQISFDGLEFRPGNLPRICRPSIKIDRLGQEVLDFAFFPGTSNLVLMHLTEGVYVVEVDDRAWQNAQLLYPGSAITMLVDGNRIYVEDEGQIMEVFTSIATQ